MLFSKIALGFAFVATALAQKIAFTSVPTSVQAGVPTVVTWAGGDGTTVTILLKQGEPNNLNTIETLTSTTGNSFTWTPDKSLPSGANYALQINQGSDVNFSGLITLSGGSASSAASSVASSSAASKTSSESATISVSASSRSGTITVTPPSTTVSVTASRNSTAITTTAIPLNATTSIIIGTGTRGASSGVFTTGNSTLSRATLSSTTGTTRGTTSGSPAGSASPSVRPSGSSAGNLASPLAFVFTAFMAIIYFG